MYTDFLTPKVQHSTKGQLPPHLLRPTLGHGYGSAAMAASVHKLKSDNTPHCHMACGRMKGEAGACILLVRTVEHVHSNWAKALVASAALFPHLHCAYFKKVDAALELVGACFAFYHLRTV